MSESLTRVYDRSDVAEVVASMPKRRPNETDKDYAERVERWRAANIVERGVARLGRFGE